jgi:hypothetical protein
MGATRKPQSYFFAGACSGAGSCTGCWAGGKAVGCGPDWITLSCDFSARGNTTRLMKSAITMKRVARMVVVLVKKSDVRRTPKTVPMLLVPSVPARPPPLLACIKITMIKNTLIRISIAIKKVYIVRPQKHVKNPNYFGVRSKYTT